MNIFKDFYKKQNLKKLKRIKNKNKQYPAIGIIAKGTYLFKFIESPNKLFCLYN